MTTKLTMLDRAAGMADSGQVSGAGSQRPNPEVPERARRRTFTATYKLEVLAAYAAAADGEKGALLRRDGLYSSHVVDWRRAAMPAHLPRWVAPRPSATRPAAGEDRPPGGREAA